MVVNGGFDKRRLLAICPPFSVKICACIIQRTSAGKKQNFFRFGKFMDIPPVDRFCPISLSKQAILVGCTA